MRRVLAEACALLAFAWSTAGAASGLIDNVSGMAVDAQGRVTRFSGLLIDADGKVEKRLKDGDKRPAQLDFRLDAKGATLLPGFIDARLDLMRYAVRLFGLDLGAATSQDDALAKVRAFAVANPDRPWVIAYGWDRAAWTTSQTLTAALLDSAVSDRPTVLMSGDGRSAWVNSAALRLAGLVKPSVAPPPARRRGTTPAPTAQPAPPAGLLTGEALAKVEAAIPRPAPKDLDVAFRKAQAALLARGITTIGDVATDIAAWQTYRRAGDIGALRLRVIGYAPGIADLALVAGPGPTPWLYGGRLRLGGLALDVGGTATGTRLRNALSRAAMDGFAVALGANDPAAATEAASAIGEVAPSYGARGQWRIDLSGGASAPVTDGIGTVAPLGTAPAPSGGASGPSALEPMEPLPALLAASGGTMEMQSDAYVALLRTLTTGGAAALGSSDRLGALEPGHYADFLLLDRATDPSRSGDSSSARIVAAWIGGRQVYPETSK